MQTDLFLEPDTLSTNLFLSLFFSSLPKSFSFFQDVHGRARAWRAPTVRRAQGAHLCVVRGTPGARLV
jgi:hypothetical protein